MWGHGMIADTPELQSSKGNKYNRLAGAQAAIHWKQSIQIESLLDVYMPLNSWKELN